MDAAVSTISSSFHGKNALPHLRFFSKTYQTTVKCKATGQVFFIFLSSWSRRPKRPRNRPSCYRVLYCIAQCSASIKSKRDRRRINLICGSCMELIINDMLQYGVLIHGPESPGFRERLLSLFRDSPFGDPPELDEDELSWSFIVENQTPSHIVQITFICSPYPRESGRSFSLQSGDSRNRVLNDQWGSMVKPGGQCPWSLLDSYWFISQKVKAPSRRDARDQEKKKLAAIDKLSVEIDGVLFSDGSFVGPDTELKFDQFEANNRGALDMIAELNRKLDAGEDAFAYAEQCASIPLEQIKELYPDPRLYARSPEIVYMWEKKMAAKFFFSLWGGRGRQAVIEWIREKANPRIPLPERFRPDITKMDEETQARFRAATDLVAELNQKLDEGEEIFAHIDRYASITRRQIEALHPDARAILPNLERTYAISKKNKAW